MKTIEKYWTWISENDLEIYIAEVNIAEIPKGIPLFLTADRARKAFAYRSGNKTRNDFPFGFEPDKIS